MWVMGYGRQGMVVRLFVPEQAMFFQEKVGDDEEGCSDAETEPGLLGDVEKVEGHAGDGLANGGDEEEADAGVV